MIEWLLQYACFDVRTDKLLSGPAEGDTMYVKR
jgi:hypothetical protein